MARTTAIRPPPGGLTIARMMIVVGVVAFLGWLARLDPLRSRWEQGVLLVLLGVLLARLLILVLFAKTCPACGGSELGRVAARPFGEHYFLCHSCGQRLKRFGLGRLWDASGPGDARHFHRDRASRIWSDGPVIPDESSPETRTVGRLLRGKIDREAEAPEPVAVLGDESAPFLPPAASRTADRGRGPRLAGIKALVADRFFRTLEAIRWSRAPRSRRP